MNKQDHTDLNIRVKVLTEAKTKADSLHEYILQVAKTIEYLRDKNYTGCELLGIFFGSPKEVTNSNGDIARHVTSTNYMRLAGVTRLAFLTELATILKESQDEYAAIKLPQ